MSNKVNDGKIKINKTAIQNEIDALKGADVDIQIKLNNQKAIIDNQKEEFVGK